MILMKYHTLLFQKIGGKTWQNLQSAAVVIGALSIKNVYSLRNKVFNFQALSNKASMTINGSTLYMQILKLLNFIFSD